MLGFVPIRLNGRRSLPPRACSFASNSRWGTGRLHARYNSMIVNLRFMLRVFGVTTCRVQPRLAHLDSDRSYEALLLFRLGVRPIELYTSRIVSLAKSTASGNTSRESWIVWIGRSGAPP